MPAQPGGPSQRFHAGRGAAGRSLRQGKEGQAGYQHGDAGAAAAGARNGCGARRRDHPVPARLWQLHGADRAQVGDGTGRRHVQATGQDPDRTLKIGPPSRRSSAPGEGGRWPWWGLAAVLTGWTVGVMVAVLLSPLRVWLALAAGLAGAVALIDRRLALLAGLSLAAFLMGAGRAALAPTGAPPAACPPPSLPGRRFPFPESSMTIRSSAKPAGDWLCAWITCLPARDRQRL